MSTQAFRFRQSTWLIVCFIALASLYQAYSADYALEQRIFPPGAPVQSALGMPHNGPANLTKEVNDQEVRAVLAQVVQAKLSAAARRVSLAVEADDWGSSEEKPPLFRLHCYRLRYPSKEAKESLPEALRRKIEEYLRIRLIGHTREYALAYFRSEPKANHEKNSVKSALAKSYLIPQSWILDWKMDGHAAGFMVKDGPLVWTFKFLGDTIWSYVVDAQEFDPDLKSKFAAARAKATMRLADRGINPGLGYMHKFARELKAVLAEDHKIAWWCLTDLNLGLFD